MPSVSSKGQVTIPKGVREDLGIGPGDEVEFEPTDEGYVLRKTTPAAQNGQDPFEKYRGTADSEDTMPERMRRLRNEYPRDVNPDDTGDEEQSGDGQ